MLNAKRELISLFLPPMDLDEESAIDEQLESNIRIYRNINAAILGEIDLDDAIEAIENDILYEDMDIYLDEIERDLKVWFNNWEVQGILLLPN